MLTENSNFTVEGLVTKYLNYVKEHCPKEYYNENGEDGWAPIHADRERQLLITLYIRVAGEQANKVIIESLSEYAKDYNDYYTNALTEEELSFLCEHFSATIEYLFSFTEKWWGYNLKGDIVSQVCLGLIKNNISPRKGETAFIANSGYCDIATLFKGCTIYGFTGTTLNDEESWAIGQIRLFAAGIKSDLIPSKKENYSHKSYTYQLPDKVAFDYIVINDETIWAYSTLESFDLHSLYESLNPKGKMIIISMFEMGKEFREMIVREKTVSSIINYKGQILGLEDRMTNHTILIIEKSKHDKVEVISLSTNRHKSIAAETLSASCLLPGYYLVDRPSNGIQLSKIAKVPSLKEELSTFKMQLDGRIKYDKENERITLPDWMLSLAVASLNDLSTDFKDANLCNKPLLKVSDPSMDKLRIRIRCVNQPCVMLGTDGESFQRLRVGFFDNIPKDTYARFTSSCLIPKGNIDVRYLTALLLLPEIKEQILSICDGDPIGSYIRYLPDLVIVPKHNKTERNMFLADALDDALKSSREELLQQHERYRKSIRMRKHALTQSLSSLEAMFYSLNEYRKRLNGLISDVDIISRVKGTTVKDAFLFIEKNLREIMPAIEHIADVEYNFEKPEWINPEQFVEDYISQNEKGWINFKPMLTWAKGHNIANADIKDEETGEMKVRKGDPFYMFYFPKDALEKIMNNIVANAISHGFTDKERKDYLLKFSWQSDDIAIVIEVENNGNPIPNDRDTSSLLEYGVSTALHQDGHNGIGCNEIDDIMRRYEGRVEIISSPDKEFKVKYKLKFNRSNSFRA